MGGRFALVLALTTAVGLAAGAGTARYTTAAPPALVATAPAPAAAPQAPTKGGGGGATQGTVDKIEGEKLTVRTGSGSVDVALTDQTTVVKQEKLAAADLKVGDN